MEYKQYATKLLMDYLEEIKEENKNHPETK